MNATIAPPSFDLRKEKGGINFIGCNGVYMFEKR